MAELNVSGGKSRRGSTLSKVPPRIDLTAMVDLAFLLITFFIMATSLAKPKAMPLVTPLNNVDSEPVPETRTMTICLGKNNQAMWYLGQVGKPIISPTVVGFDRSGLRAALVSTGKMVSARSGKPMIVIVKAAQHSVYSNFVATLDELNITGVESYAIAKISPEDIDLLKQKSLY